MSYYPTLDEIVRGLQARAEDVARTYAPGGRVEGGRYWALNPGRHDTRIGSFYVGLRGQWAGRWRDEVTKDMGDMLDLIQLALGTDKKAAIEEAKRFLGLGSETPQARARRLEREARLAERQCIEAERDAQRAAARSRAAQAIFLEARADLAGTPVEAYLASRGIELGRLPRVPGAIRYHPRLRYYQTDKTTGRVYEGVFAAMVTAIHSGWSDGGNVRFIGVHRTYLEPAVGGGWQKAGVPKAKLVLGAKKGGYIRLWAGRGPRGGKPAALDKAGTAARLYITEGIEDGLSVAMLDPVRRVAAAVDLGNIAEMRLPPSARDLVIVADNDPHPEQAAQIEKAVKVFSAQGRRVAVWRNHWGGKDINDALIAALKKGGAA